MTLKDMPVFVIIIILTFIVHEAGHWLVGQSMGYDMYLSINRVGAVGDTPSAMEAMWIKAGGPLVTLAQGIIGFALVWVARSRLAFLVVFAAFFMRLLAAGISFINPNDEAAIGAALGLPVWLVPGLAVAFLFLLAVLATRRMQFGWRTWLLCWIVGSIVTTGIVFGDDYIPYWHPVSGWTIG
ncbi:hypothetical protein FF098_015695 [Parvularcula flava]|uniref:Uncharacterized protein n=1 Tax=Aquisalinus luteolus TaxID=1566827 RepID=A0A8J3A993_9PROT|nr:hypothetical protein [Aquisalinus luteolus]NHK29361.1 hypothetical protein [Aquisalinus luteolus]GGI01013.1 hypothetical protein GCM10011355_30650 [Aquisalinus luteolus]